MELKEQIIKDIKNNPVILYMKDTHGKDKYAVVF